MYIRISIEICRPRYGKNFYWKCGNFVLMNMSIIDETVLEKYIIKQISYFQLQVQFSVYYSRTWETESAAFPYSLVYPEISVKSL